MIRLRLANTYKAAEILASNFKLPRMWTQSFSLFVSFLFFSLYFSLFLFFFSLSICLCVCRSVSLFLSVCVCLPVCLTLSLSLFPSFYQSLTFSLYLLLFFYLVLSLQMQKAKLCKWLNGQNKYICYLLIGQSSRIQKWLNISINFTVFASTCTTWNLTI